MHDAPIEGAGLSFIGSTREENQDAIRLQPTVSDSILSEYGYLYGVADGMGGYEHGGIASTVALEVFFDAFYASAPGKSAAALKSAMQQANTAVQRESVRLGSVRMGTTLSAVNIVGSQLFISHVGDSRVYLVRGRHTTCLTDDHTRVGEMVRMKLIPPSSVRHHDQRSVLNRALGTQLFVQPDVTQHTIHAGDTLILCTDGVWSVIEDEEFGHIVHQEREPARINQRLIDESVARESDDNASAITIHIHGLPAVAVQAENSKLRGLSKLLNIKRFAVV